jgi:hypothetical protein
VTAVVPYTCTCGEEFLISLRTPEQAQEDVLANGLWGRTVREVADGLGAQYIDRGDTPTFVCTGCQTVHTREGGQPSDALPTAVVT